MKQRIQLQGVDCASCALAIETVLDRLAGVHSCEVDDRTNVLTVAFDEKQCSTDNVIASIREAGFGAEVIQ